MDTSSGLTPLATVLSWHITRTEYKVVKEISELVETGTVALYDNWGDYLY